MIATWASSAKLEEALALGVAMIQAKQQGWKKVEFESNCKEVVDKVNGEENDYYDKGY